VIYTCFCYNIRECYFGKIIQKEDLIFKRPAYGISPKFLEEVIGKRARRDIKEDEILKWEMLEE